MYPMPNWNDPLASRERVSLAAATASHSWDWLVELRRHLKVDFQLLDEHQVPLLPPAGGESDTISRLLTSPPPALTRAIAAGLQSEGSQALAVDAVQVVCRGISVQRRVAGVLVLARAVPDGAGGLPAARTRLEIMASLLAGSIQAHLLSPPITNASALQHVLPLWRLLTGVARRESDREVIASFIEAMAVWHDLEAGGYVRTARGTFRRAVTVAGRVGADRPIALPEGTATPLTLRRLPHSELDAEASAFAQDPLFTLLRAGDRVGGWLIVLSGADDSCDRELLHNYLAILDLAVGSAVIAATARVQAVVADKLWRDAAEGHDAAARAALAEVLALTESRSAVLTATAPGMPVWQLDESRPGIVSQNAVAQLVVTGADESPMVTLTLSRDDGGQFTYANAQAAEAAAVLFQSWMRESLRTNTLRGGSEPFEAILEQRAQEALLRGDTVTAGVLAIESERSAAVAPLLEALRTQVRETDGVGLLSDGQIGVLFLNTTAAKASAVLARLERAVAERTGAGEVRIAGAGFATRTPAEGANGQLLPEARRNAMQRKAAGTPLGKV